MNARGAPKPADGFESTAVARRVVILANRADSESLRLAEHYRSRRGVPAANVIALPMSLDETIGWPEFVRTVWTPLLDRLVTEKWIDAIPMNAHDVVGRRKYAVHHHRIEALVLCRGVPLRVEHDAALYAPVAPYTSRAEFRTNSGALDAELSLLPQPNYPINAFVPNPLFQNSRPLEGELDQVVKVARLDAPSLEDAFAMVDQAIAVERSGLMGRAYIDLSDRDPIGNAWLETAAKIVDELGFDLAIDRASGTFPPTARLDAPALYFGWYAARIEGGLAVPGFRFAPGAIALHIHSYSATTLRSESSGWTGPLAARGAAGAFGNVNEPYLQWTHRPDLLLRALARGATLVEASYQAFQALSWQQVVIGDPLYRPFAVSLEQQLDRIEQLEPKQAGYVWLRRARLLDRAGAGEEALTLLRTAHAQRPSMAVALDLARREFALGNKAVGRAVLGTLTRDARLSTNEWGLIAAAAQLAADHGEAALSLGLWRHLFTHGGVPGYVCREWLQEAAAHAAKAGDIGQAERWRAEARMLGSN